MFGHEARASDKVSIWCDSKKTVGPPKLLCFFLEDSLYATYIAHQSQRNYTIINLHPALLRDQFVTVCSDSNQPRKPAPSLRSSVHSHCAFARNHCREANGVGSRE